LTELKIWFQNRRQNDRRKSKPLLPHELLPHFRNGIPREVLQQTSSPDPVAPVLDSGSFTSITHAHPSTNPASLEEPGSSSQRSAGIQDILNPPSSAETEASGDASNDASQNTVEHSTPSSSLEEPQEAVADSVEKDVVAAKGHLEDEEDQPVNSPSQPSSGRKRAHDEMTGASAEASTSQEATATKTPNLGAPRPSSFVRLAMTVDGAVKVRTNDEPTPSPEKPKAPPPNLNKRSEALARSQSAVNNDIYKDVAHSPLPRPFGGGFGRSRDARTWEFFCDSDAREALSSHAEAERSGSAVGAINLIRSNSQKARMRALSPATSRVNARLHSSVQKSGKPNLSRAKSSMARLQNLGTDGASDDPKGKRPAHYRSPSGDSDKENWAPGTRDSQTPLRRTRPGRAGRPILENNEDLVYADASSTPSRRSIGVGKENTEGLIGKPAAGKEKAKGEELDCINGLLSLSQGAWK